MKSSWVTSVLGYVIIGITWLEQVFVEQGIPQSAAEWKRLQSELERLSNQA